MDMDDKPKMIIAIDGTAASGKGTLGRSLAEYLGLDYLDTGQLYRMLAYLITTQGLDCETLTETQCTHLIDQIETLPAFNGALRTAEIGEAASKIATMPVIRAGLLIKQRAFAENPPHGKGAILDGRDIGTTILPEADIKFFVDAAADIRATRRHQELQDKGYEGSFADILADLIKRDCRDKNRTVAPLKAAHDAILIDTSDKNAHEVLQTALDYVNQHM